MRKIISVIMAVIMCLGIIAGAAIAVYADENGDIFEETTTATTEAKPQEPTAPVEPATDSPIPWYSTGSEREGKGEVKITINCIEGFKSDIIVEFTRVANGQGYYITLRQIDGYSGSIWLPEDKYTIDKVTCGDYPNTAFDVGVSSFYIEKDKYQAFSFKMIEGENNPFGNGEITEPDGQVIQSPEFSGASSVLTTTRYDYIKMDEKGELHYAVSQPEGSNVLMGAHGFSSIESDITVVINKPGIIGEATFNMYDSNGFVLAKNQTVKDECEEIYGIILTFTADKDTNELKKDDKYTFKTIECYPTSSSAKPYEAMLMVVGDPVKNAEYKIEVMSSGGLGISKLSVTEIVDKNKTSTIYQLPEDGKLEIDGLIFMFDGEEGYKKGATFSVEIDRAIETTSYTPLYVMAAFAVIALIFGIVFIISKKDKRSDYILRPYKWRKDDSAY